MDFRTIVVGVDFSPASLAAVRHACTLAGDEGVVRLVHVVDSSRMPQHAFLGRDVVEGFYAQLETEARRTIEELARDLRANGSRVEAEVRQGPPVDEMLEASAKADLAIVGAHARDAIGRLVLGSVAEAVARRNPVPTLVVRERESSPKVTRVLVAVDVVDPLTEAIGAASDLASRLGVQLEAIHVVPEVSGMSVARSRASGKLMSDLESRIRKEAPRAVRSIISKAIGKGAAIHVAFGSAAREIVRYARPSDLLVCGTHGRGAIGRFFFGSVATKVMRRSPCPVLLVRPSAVKAKVKARG